ncbi:MAG: hypothetical protein NZU63_14580 [Gemmataceae bacterium]|nr:hypothetical protein [Gemmataceae bacterium]MDW8243718.1 hypothetical protein [Thermogemmata sp.]
MHRPGPLQRMVAHSLVAAVILAVLGYLLAQWAALAVSQLQVTPPTSAPLAEVEAGITTPETNLSTTQLVESLRWQLPLRLAGLGVLLVVIGEGLIWLLRRNNTPRGHSTGASVSATSAPLSPPVASDSPATCIMTAQPTTAEQQIPSRIKGRS